ncbi:GNAT family N-acetyltransferase [Streptomyces sp. ST2-7A]|uniref:GNAT family N-acetyltransferase n=1 Tax=Streptomyces sp. ST2-7A TaxID=2907214 RepID=UPI0035AB7574
MRLALDEDRGQISEMVRERMAWMREQGIPDWPRSNEDVEVIASQAGSGKPVWVLVSPEGRVIGCTSLYDKTPAWGWSDEELKQSAYFLATSFTHPAYRRERPGQIMALWALDRAAHNGIDWVRRGTFSHRLMVYYRDEQGWQLVHTPERKGHRAYLMARPSEPQPELAGVITDSVVPMSDGCTTKKVNE